MPQGGHPPHHSITSSARARTVSGTVRPRALAVYAKKEAKDAARYKFLVEPALAAYRKTRGQLPRQALKVQYSAQILDNGNWFIQDVSVNPLSTR
jgi:hypothetical protein